MFDKWVRECACGAVSCSDECVRVRVQTFGVAVLFVACKVEECPRKLKGSLCCASTTTLLKLALFCEFNANMMID